MYAEREARPASGWLLLVINFILYVFSVWLFVRGFQIGHLWTILSSTLVLTLSVFVSLGFFVLAPNEASVLLLFGDYRGSVKRNGFWWTNPLMKKIKVSLRARTLNGERLKVNDQIGNPIDIAAIVVWQVHETAQALFDVDNYSEYVKLQSETAVRHLASAYPYDGPENELSLRGATDEINHHLQRELHDRLTRAGVNVVEARFSHLAYAPEIAGEMLRRQQASAVVAARFKIVEGAVGMVEHALVELGKSGQVHLDDERRAAMVSNLMVVLCSEHGARPVVNTGTLYH